MRQSKDGHYTVYLLPSEWYVGYTGSILNRMAVHKCKQNKDTSNWIVLAEVDNKLDALDIEAHYHNRGYNGKRYIKYKSFQQRRIANTDFKKRSANTDYKAAAIKKQKPIIQLTLKGEFIREWESVNAAAEGIGVTASGLSICLKGKCPTIKGFKWEYKI
jgi:predicted GIY-YIG superfamily endonuclease